LHQFADVISNAQVKEIAAASSRQFTDLHLAELAARHEMKLATLDTGISQLAIEIVVS
jgi:predicted nucleic acid-binding protein